MLAFAPLGAAAVSFAEDTAKPANAPAAEQVAGAAGAVEQTTETPAAAPAPAKAPAEKHGDLSFRLLGTAALSDGDTAQFQQRHRIPENVSGGIDYFHYGNEIGKGTDLDLDGRAIFDNHDYLLNLKIHNEDKGYIDLGYRQFRTWYDDRGGYYPPANAMFAAPNNQLGLDRGEAWARGGLVLPMGFRLSVAYRYLYRDGNKSSIEWGDSTALGISSSNNQRNIVPAFYNIDEDRHQVDVALDRKTDNTNMGGAFHYEHTDINDSRNASRKPGEAGQERVFTQRDDSNGDTYGAHAYGTWHLLDDKLTLSGAYGYNNLNLNLGGSRIYGATFDPIYDPVYANRQQRDEGFLDLTGETRMRENVANASALAHPFADVDVLGTLRFRDEHSNAHDDFVETNVGGSPDFIATQDPLRARSDTDEVSYAEDLEVRYRGVKNVVFYARGQWEQNDGHLAENETEAATSAVELERASGIDRNRQDYALGAKVYPTTWLNLSGEYAYRVSDYSYVHHVDSTPNDSASGDRYPAYIVGQNFATDDFNVRSTFRLPENISLVLRYDWLQTTIHTREDLLDRIESAQSRAHMFGGTITWNPMIWWWTRFGANYVLNTTDTSANNYVTPVAAIFPSFDNDFVLLNAASGVAIDNNTDLDLTGHWFRTTNYKDLSAVGLSYGSKSEETGVMLRVTRRINEHMKVGGGYGFFVNDEAFAGGNYDYHVHILTTTFEYER